MAVKHRTPDPSRVAPLIPPARTSGEHRLDTAPAESRTEISALSPDSERQSIVDGELIDAVMLLESLRGQPPHVVIRGVQRCAALLIVLATSAAALEGPVSR